MERLPLLLDVMDTRGGTGDFGGGALEPPRRWLGSHWPGFTLGVPSCPGPPGAP